MLDNHTSTGHGSEVQFHISLNSNSFPCRLYVFELSIIQYVGFELELIAVVVEITFRFARVPVISLLKEEIVKIRSRNNSTKCFLNDLISITETMVFIPGIR